MDYQDIQKTIDTFPHYTFPIQADDEDGNKIVITEGEGPIYLMNEGKEVELHYYKVYTYLPDNKVKVSTFYENGAFTIEYQ